MAFGPDQPAINGPRRFYLLSSQSYDLAGLGGTALVFRYKQAQAAGQILPQNFPGYLPLGCARYWTVEDLYGANEDELTRIPGINGRLATAILSALDAMLTARTTMGYITQNPPQKGRYANTLDLSSILGAVTQTASGVGPILEPGDRGTLRLDFAVSAAIGTNPTLDVFVQTSADGATWRVLGTFPQATGTTTSVRKSFPGCDRFCQVAWTIGGTGGPSFTFSVGGEGC